MRKTFCVISAALVVLLGWWLGGGEFVRGPELARVVAASAYAAVLVFFLLDWL